MLLVRSEEEESTLVTATEAQGGLIEVLRHCGIPRDWGEKAMAGRDAQKEIIDDLA
jgi:ATP adenylyltransferase